MHLFGNGFKNRSFMFLAVIPAKLLEADDLGGTWGRIWAYDKFQKALPAGAVVKL